MLIKKNFKDATSGRATPLPTQIVGNEEFVPMPQTDKQRNVEARIFERADANAKKLGMSRREFLCTTGGMATAFLAFNDVFGPTFNVHAAEALEPQAYRERWPKGEFILDVQTHHVKDSISGPLAFRKLTAKYGMNPDLLGIDPRSGDLHRTNFLKEMFFDSDTVMGLISGAAIGEPDNYMITIEDMVATRDLINRAASSQRMMSHGIVDPTRPDALDEATRQVELYDICGFKLYTGNPGAPWMFTDEEVSWPILEHARSLGKINICTHKGLALPGKIEKYFVPTDMPVIAKQFRDLNFIIYHSGMQHMMAQTPANFVGVDADGYIPWTTDLCRARDEDPDMTNIYMELGGVFGYSVITHPDICGHLLGQLIRSFGADHIIWGTDCIWWGSPQWLIEAFRRFQIPQHLQDEFGYAPITDEDRHLIFGINAAGLFDIDVDAKRTEIPADALTAMKVGYTEQGADPSNTAYGWVPEAD
jgi:predicted TIM-barrel fold metal-dependent hydrolase